MYVFNVLKRKKQGGDTIPLKNQFKKIEFGNSHKDKNVPTQTLKATLYFLPRFRLNSTRCVGRKERVEGEDGRREAGEVRRGHRSHHGTW